MKNQLLILVESGSMKFVLLTKYSVRLIEAEDIEEAIKSEYDDNTGKNKANQIGQINQINNHIN